MTVLRHLVRDRFSILDGLALMYGGYLVLSGSIAKAFIFVIVSSLASGVITGVVRVIDGGRKLRGSCQRDLAQDQTAGYVMLCGIGQQPDRNSRCPAYRSQLHSFYNFRWLMTESLGTSC